MNCGTFIFTILATRTCRRIPWSPWITRYLLRFLVCNAFGSPTHLEFLRTLQSGRAIGPLGNIELGLNEWDLGVSYSWTKPRNLDFIHVCVVDWLSISSFCFRMMLEHWDLDGSSYGVLVYLWIRTAPHKRGRRWHARPQTWTIQEFEGKRVMLLAAGRRSFTGLRLESI